MEIVGIDRFSVVPAFFYDGNNQKSNIHMVIYELRWQGHEWMANKVIQYQRDANNLQIRKQICEAMIVPKIAKTMPKAKKGGQQQQQQQQQQQLQQQQQQQQQYWLIDLKMKKRASCLYWNIPFEMRFKRQKQWLW